MHGRRRFLRTGAAAVSGLGALAGCTTDGTPSPGTTPTGTAATGTPTYDAPAWFTDRGDLANTASVDGSVSLPLSERWTASLGDAAGTPVGGHGDLLVGSHDGKVYALSPQDGSTSWTYDVGAAVSAAPTAVARNKGATRWVFVTGDDGALYSVDPGNQTERWATSGGSGSFNSAPNYATGRVFYAYMSGGVTSRLRAVDGQSGSIEWESPAHNITTATPMHGFGSIHLGVPQIGGVLYSYDDATGDGNWTYQNDEPGSSGSETSGVLDTDVAQGSPARIYFSPMETEMAGVRAAGGTGLWSTTLPNFGIVYGLALTQERSPNTLVVAQRRHLYAMDPASGTVQWTYSHGPLSRNGSNGRVPRPAVYGDHVFHVVDGNKLVAVSLSSGGEDWSTRLDGATHAAPCVGGDTVYVATTKGTVYAFSP